MNLGPVKRDKITPRQPSSNVTIKGRLKLLLCLSAQKPFFIYQNTCFTNTAQFSLCSAAFILTLLNRQRFFVCFSLKAFYTSRVAGLLFSGFKRVLSVSLRALSLQRRMKPELDLCKRTPMECLLGRKCKKLRSRK